MLTLMDILTQLATSVRLKLGEEGMVIWYDSVTIQEFYALICPCGLFTFDIYLLLIYVSVF